MVCLGRIDCTNYQHLNESQDSGNLCVNWPDLGHVLVL